MVATTLASSAVALSPTRLYSVSSTFSSYLETRVFGAFQMSYSAISGPQDRYYVMGRTASGVFGFL